MNLKISKQYVLITGQNQYKMIMHICLFFTFFIFQFYRVFKYWQTIFQSSESDMQRQISFCLIDTGRIKWSSHFTGSFYNIYHNIVILQKRNFACSYNMN